MENQGGDPASRRSEREPLMATASQLKLSIPVAQRTTLVTVETVRAALAVDVETVWGWIDDGTIIWAWDISAAERRGEANRELRVWVRDVLRLCGHTLGSVVEPGLPQAIRTIIGHDRDRIAVQELVHTLCASRQHIHRLISSGLLIGPRVGQRQFVTRNSLVAFLEERHIT